MKKVTPILRSWHNHFDNYGNNIPGFCGGISLGNCKKLDALLQKGIDTGQFPVPGFLIDNDMKRLYLFVKDLGYADRPEGYLSKRHLFMDMKRHIALHGDLPELQLKEFYLQLE